MRSIELSTASIGVGFDGSDMAIKKLLANPNDHDVVDNPNWICPEVGDKVEILSFDNQLNVQECLKVSKLPSLTIKTVNPVVIHMGKQGYFWTYDITVEETSLKFIQFHYRLIHSL